MQLSFVVETSGQVAGTRSRNAKRDALADLLRQVGPEEIEIATAYLSGVLVQRRTGVGWRALSRLPTPAPLPSLTLTEVNATLERISQLAGAGSAGSRQRELAGLYSLLTRAEQEFLRSVMTGSVRQGALDSVMLDAIAVAASVPVPVVRRAAMFSAPTGPIAVAALTGGSRALEGFRLEVGRPVRPMLASAAPDVAAAMAGHAGDWLVDTKLDGIRIQAHKDGEQVTVFTRSLDEVGERLPQVVETVRALAPHRLILDGESVQGQPWFFDLLLHEDTGLLDLPLADRVTALDGVVSRERRTRRLVSGDVAEAEQFFDEQVAGGQEGVVLKDLAAPYQSGRRGTAWVKVKPRHTLDLVVLAAEWGSGRRRGWLSNIHLGARTADGFVMLGKTFKGMSDQMLAWQTDRFLALETHREGHTVHVRPEQVVEIAFDSLHRSTRYPGGVGIRFARVLGYREDKGPAQADTLATVQAMAAG